MHKWDSLTTCNNTRFVTNQYTGFSKHSFTCSLSINIPDFLTTSIWFPNHYCTGFPDYKYTCDSLTSSKPSVYGILYVKYKEFPKHKYTGFPNHQYTGYLTSSIKNSLTTSIRDSLTTSIKNFLTNSIRDSLTTSIRDSLSIGIGVP